MKSREFTQALTKLLRITGSVEMGTHPIANQRRVKDYSTLAAVKLDRRHGTTR
ncbi:MAG: hypothetical protein AB8B64_01330 [Granulosicoccus sp.]